MLEHVIQYHLHLAQELETEYRQDRRRTRVRDKMLEHLQVAYTMRRWPDFIDFTDLVGIGASFAPTFFNTQRS